MALKGFHDPVDFDLSAFMLTEGEAGGVVVHAHTGAFGPDMDEVDNVVAYAANSSGKVPAGLLLHTVDDYDPTRVARNFQNDDVVPVGSKVTLVKRGTYITDMIDPARLSSIVPGNAYLAGTGLLTDQTGGGVFPLVGVFHSYADSDGFVKVGFNIA